MAVDSAAQPILLLLLVAVDPGVPGIKSPPDSHLFRPAFRAIRSNPRPHFTLSVISRLPRAWHLPFRPKDECAIFRVHDGKNMSPSLGGSPFKL